jgi:hypothetical protein
MHSPEIHGWPGGHPSGHRFRGGCPDLFLLARILGHSHTRVTEIYAHLLPDHLRRARNGVDVSAPEVAPAGSVDEEAPEDQAHSDPGEVDGDGRDAAGDDGVTKEEVGDDD